MLMEDVKVSPEGIAIAAVAVTRRAATILPRRPPTEGARTERGVALMVALVLVVVVVGFSVAMTNDLER